MKNDRFEQALRESERKYRTLVENLNEVVYMLNERAEITYITPNIESFSGYTVEEVTGRRFTDFVHPEDLHQRMERFRNAYSGKNQATEYRLLKKNGEVAWVRTSARPIIEDGRTLGVQGVLTEITDRKVYEEKLERQFACSRALNRILDTIISEEHSEPVLDTIVEVMGKTLQLDRALIYEIRFEEQLAIGLSEWLNPDCPDLDPSIGSYPLSSLGEGTAWMLTTRQYLESHADQIHPNLVDGGFAGILHDRMKIKSLLWHPFAFHDDGFYILVFNQIRYRRQWTREEFEFLETLNRQVRLAMQKLAFLKEHREAREQLYRSEKKFRGIFENAPLGIFHFDSNGVITECNDNFMRIIGSSRNRLIGLETLRLPDPEMVTALKTVLSGKKTSYEGNYQSVTADKITPVKVSFEPVVSEDGKVQGGIGIVEDITERRKAEESIRKSLEEKNILLSEIHHRVKNNMAVISSMISLQSEFFHEGKDTAEIFKITQSRIRSMALVHELVYENDNFTEIGLDRLLHQLTGNIKRIYQPNGRSIRLDIKTEEIRLNMNDSVPFSLYVNEVISNAFKHAFNGREHGVITVQLTRKEDGCQVVIGDDGCGVTDLAMLDRPKSLGFTIIHGLVTQLRGRLEITPRNPGLQLSLWIPLDRSDNPSGSGEPAGS